MSTPIISIIIPFYNTEPFFYIRMLCSLKELPCELFETLIVDDGSNESSFVGLKENVGIYMPRAKLFQKSNGGQNSARQFAIERASGKYVLFLDSDDYLDSRELLSLANYLNEAEPDVVAFNYDIVTPEGELLNSCNTWPEGFHNASKECLLLTSDSLFRQCYNLQRLRELPFGLVQGVRIGEDLASSLSINLSLNNCVSYGGTVYHYVKRPTSIIHRTPAEAVYDVLLAFEEIINRCGPNYSDCFEEIEWMAILHCVGWNSLRLLRGGVDFSEGRERTFKWMQNRFPDWKKNRYIKKSKFYKDIWFRLSIDGHWLLLALFLKAWDAGKKFVHRRK